MVFLFVIFFLQRRSLIKQLLPVLFIRTEAVV